MEIKKLLKITVDFNKVAVDIKMVLI